MYGVPSIQEDREGYRGKKKIPREAVGRTTRKCVRWKRDEWIVEEGRREDASSCFEGAWVFSQRVRSVRMVERGPLVGDKRETYEG